MDDALSMGGVERRGDRDAVAQHFIDADRCRVEHLGQGAPLDQLHHDPRAVLVLEDIEHLHDRRMSELRQQARLLLQPGAELHLVGAGGPDPLDGHPATQALIVGQVDLPHAAASEQRLQLVAPTIPAGIHRQWWFRGAVLLHSLR